MAARSIRTNMAGTITRVEVRAGDSVTKEQVIAIIEVMKMEIAIESPDAGRVSRLHVTGGDLVDEGQTLITLDT